MRAQRHEKFAAVIEVVFENVPDDPLARVGVFLSLIDFSVGMGQIGNGPAREIILEHLPGDLQTVDEVGDATSRLIRAVPVEKRDDLFTCVAQFIKPAGADGDDVREDVVG